MRAVASLGLLLLAAPSCAPLITPTGVAMTAGAAGGTMTMQERGLGGAIEDNAIAVAINDAWLNNDAAIFRKVSTSIHDGVVVLTGHVTYRETAQRAETLARGVEGVRTVINHIRVEREPGIGTVLADRWITTELRAALTFTKDVNAVNYSIDTVAGTVFLSGVAQDQAELDRVVARARRTSGVRDVVTAVRLRSEPLPPRNLSTVAAVTPPPPSAAEAPLLPAMPRGATAVTAEPLPPPR